LSRFSLMKSRKEMNYKNIHFGMMLVKHCDRVCISSTFVNVVFLTFNTKCWRLTRNVLHFCCRKETRRILQLLHFFIKWVFICADSNSSWILFRQRIDRIKWRLPFIVISTTSNVWIGYQNFSFPFY
jgi:hypothetical protein